MQRLTTIAPPTFFVELFPFEIFSIKSCPLYNFDTVQDNFTKLGRNINYDRQRAEINNSCSTCIFGGIIIFLCNFPYRNCVHSIALIPLEIISRNLPQILSMTRGHAEINNSRSTYIFCGIIPLCNFQY